jgi:hypothetical protein
MYEKAEKLNAILFLVMGVYLRSIGCLLKEQNSTLQGSSIIYLW